LDASLSMTARADDGQTRFEKAVSQAENLVQSSGAGDGFTLLVLAGGVETIVSGPSHDKGKGVDELRRLKPTHTPADTASAIERIADVLGRSPLRSYPRRQVTFLSDLQRSAWANVLPKSDSPLPEVAQRVFGRLDVDVAVVDVARSDADFNLAVT